jgi:hypothetical protein
VKAGAETADSLKKTTSTHLAPLTTYQPQFRFFGPAARISLPRSVCLGVVESHLVGALLLLAVDRLPQQISQGQLGVFAAAWIRQVLSDQIGPPPELTLDPWVIRKWSNRGCGIIGLVQTVRGTMAKSGKDRQ